MKTATWLATSAAAFCFAAQVNAAEVVDSAKNADKVGTTLDDTCTSYKSKDVEACINAHLSLTLGLSQAFIKYQKSPAVSRILKEACEDNFNAIVGSLPPDLISKNPEKYLPEFVKTGLLGARYCLEKIESVGNEYEIDYMPTTRKILNQFIDNAEQGKIIFKYDI